MPANVSNYCMDALRFGNETVTISCEFIELSFPVTAGFFGGWSFELT